jgi:hypothetical protein
VLGSPEAMEKWMQTWACTNFQENLLSSSHHECHQPITVSNPSQHLYGNQTSRYNKRRSYRCRTQPLRHHKISLKIWPLMRRVWNSSLAASIQGRLHHTTVDRCLLHNFSSMLTMGRLNPTLTPENGHIHLCQVLTTFALYSDHILPMALGVKTVQTVIQVMKSCATLGGALVKVAKNYFFPKSHFSC